MSDWASIQSAIPAAVRRILGDASDVGWSERRSRWRSSSHCRLRLVSKRQLGREELRRTDNLDGTFTERSYTPTLLTVQFTFTAQDQDLAESALPNAEAVAVGLRLTDTFVVLCEAGLGVSTVGPMTIADFIDDKGRWQSSVTFEVVFNAHSSITTSAGRTTDYVDHVVVKDQEIPDIP